MFSAIAARDAATALRLLAETPGLARQAAVGGATRQEAKAYFFDAIMHYAYGGDTALHMAAAAYATDIARDLLARGADVRAKNRRGAEPLHYAADGHPDSPGWNPDAQAAVIRLLIEASADANAADKSGVAPLHRAARTRCAAAVDALLTGGADVRLKNEKGSTALHLAVQDTGRGGSGSDAAREQQMQVIRLLIAHGARPMDTNAAGKSVRECVRADWVAGLLDER